MTQLDYDWHFLLMLRYEEEIREDVIRLVCERQCIFRQSETGEGDAFGKLCRRTGGHEDLAAGTWS